MNILQVIPYFTFSRGGDVAVCYNLSKQLTDKGHSVTILTSTFEFNPEDTETIENLEVVPVDYKFNLALFIYTPDMKKWLRENIENYDIIHLHELRSYQNNIIMKYAEKYNIPYIVQPHASTPRNINRSFIKYVYDLIYGNRIMKNSSGVIAVSKEEAEYDEKMKKDNVDVIYNGMNLEEYEKLPEKGLFYNKIKSPYILYLGRMDKLKGIDHLIKSFSTITGKFPEHKLVIAGKITEYKQELDKIIKQESIENKVIFTGFIDQKDKISIYQDADLFVNAVKYMGGVSLTVFESILANTPVVVTRQSGEIIEKIDAGLIVEYGDSEELERAMTRLLTDKNLAEKQLKNGQEYINNNLQWSKVADEIITIYNKHTKG